MILDKAGNLYGTASYGGLLSNCSGVGCGVVFELSLGLDGHWTETVLHSFTETEGALPSSALVFGVKGILYGTTPRAAPARIAEGLRRTAAVRSSDSHPPLRLDGNDSGKL